MVAFQLAEALQQPLSEVLSWPVDHIRGWLAYYSLQEEKRNARK